MRWFRCWRRINKHKLISSIGCLRLLGWFAPVLHLITLKQRSIFGFSGKNVCLLICYYCLGLGWGFLYFSLMRVTLLSLVYQKNCNRLSSTNFHGRCNTDGARFSETWPLDPAYFFLNYASCMMWWGFGSEFVMPMVKCSMYMLIMLISCTVFFNDSFMC